MLGQLLTLLFTCFIHFVLFCLLWDFFFSALLEVVTASTCTTLSLSLGSHSDPALPVKLFLFAQVHSTLPFSKTLAGSSHSWEFLINHIVFLVIFHMYASSLSNYSIHLSSLGLCMYFSVICVKHQV